MKSEEVDVFRIYKKRGFFLSVLKKIYLKLDIFCHLWYESWIHQAADYHTIIVFATADYTFLRKIRKRYPHIKFIFWYWNPALLMRLPRKELFDLAQVWSFDPVDCATYNWNFNTTFYFKDILLEDKDIKYDTVFLGINKGRRTFLNDLEIKLQKLSLINYFHIVPDKNEENLENVKPVPYSDYLKIVAESRCIIDVMQKGQSGLTLRAMESIFLRKKLITNDLNIVNEDFYNSKNIFVLGVDNFDDLNIFIASPYMDIESQIVDKYDFKSWLRRFSTNE